MESAIVGDKGSTTLGKNGNTKLENNSLCRCQDYSMIDGLYDNTRIAKGGTPLPLHLPRVRKHERIIHHHINIYDDWYRLIKATGKFVGSDNKSANYQLEMGYDNLYNITSKKMTMTQTNLQFAGTLSAGHEFSYNYSTDNPMQLASVETKQYNVDGEVSDVDAKLSDNKRTQNYEFDANGNMVSVSVAKKEEPKPEVENPEGQEALEEPEEKDILKSFLWDEENRLLALNNNGSVSCYFYDAAGERTVKLTSETEMVHVNGKKVGGNDNICKFTAYVSPYFVVSNGGAYTKHIYAANQRIASKLGNVDGFGADPRRVEMAGGKKISDFQKDKIEARFEELGFTYSAPEKEKVIPDSTVDSEEKESLVFYYHPDHLGSTSYVTDADGNIAQHIEYIPYGEVFVEERNSQFSTNFLFNAKELDNETGLYYYGARYLDPTGAMWLSVDPMWEKYMGMSPYNYCMGNPVKLVDPDGNAPFVKNDEDGEFYAYDYDKDAFYPMGSLGYYDDRDNNKYTPGENSFLNKFRNEYRQLNDKTETGKEIVDYFRTHNCYIESYDSNANVDGYKGSHTNSTDLFTIYLDLNSCYDQRVPTLSGMFPLFTPKWLVLGHELSHVIDFQSRGSAARAVDFGGFMNSEIYATHMENRMRSEARLPLREFYDNNYPDTRLIEPLTSGIYRSVAYRDNDNSPSFYNNYNRINDRRYFMPTKYKPSF